MRITTRLIRKPPLFCLLTLMFASVPACETSKTIPSPPNAADSGSDVPTNSSQSEWMAASNWDVVSEYMFEDHGKVLFEQNQIVLQGGDPATGIRFNGDVPSDAYEVSFDAKRVSGNDFFCGMTLPVGSEHCTLILGGWSGTIVGLSNVDEEPAAENITATSIDFVNGRWYAVRVEVSPSIRVWIDGRKIIELDRSGHTFSLWWEQEEMAPFGIATWGTTTAAIRNLQVASQQPAAVEK